jgi:hypothetical protein
MDDALVQLHPNWTSLCALHLTELLRVLDKGGKVAAVRLPKED